MNSDVAFKWEYDNTYKKSILGFCGFVFQFILLILLFFFTKNRQFGFAIALPLMFTFFAWLIWWKESKNVRRNITEYLNEFGDEDSRHFRIPKFSFLNMRYVPEIALALIFQVVFIMLLIN